MSEEIVENAPNMNIWLIEDDKKILTKNLFQNKLSNNIFIKRHHHFSTEENLSNIYQMLVFDKCLTGFPRPYHYINKTYKAGT